ncbi:MAG: hypothetical protein IKK34_12980 [Clostridia bacterium]|nr:hypothetical protein [Clostridia bacterium]
MIDAIFGTQERSAAAAGAYQYDTGQRIRLHGIPTPEELAEMDDFIDGDVVTVQVQYSYTGDSQTEMRLAAYDAREGVWMAQVPDVYLLRSEDVHLYVYVSYGESAEKGRAKTMYEAVFRPIGRPAPSDAVTPDQINAWNALVQEINLAISSTNTAESGANAAADVALTAAENAREAAQGAQNAAEEAKGDGALVQRAWMNATVSADTLEPGAAATVTLTENEGIKHLAYGIPRGRDGEKGDKGDKGDTGPAGVRFTLEGTVLYIETYD